MKTTVIEMAAARIPPHMDERPPLMTMAATIARRRLGKAYTASAMTTSTRSSQPPRYPESSPSSTPTKMESSTATTMTISAVRVPQMTRESTSYPPTVVPSRWSPPGGTWAPNRPSASRSCAGP